MSAAAFDTLSAAQDLEAAGIERRQAEAIAKAINHGDERAATKADLATAIAELKADNASLRADLYRALWIQGGAIVAILTALRFFPA